MTMATNTTPDLIIGLGENRYGWLAVMDRDGQCRVATAPSP